MHENLWDECKRDIAATQKDLNQVSKQCPTSASITAFDTLLDEYSEQVKDATMTATTNGSDIVSITTSNMEQEIRLNGDPTAVPDPIVGIIE